MSLQKKSQCLKYVVITRTHTQVNFGQIVHFEAYNEITEEIYVIPQGERYEVAMHYSEVFPCEWYEDFSALNECMDKLKS